MPVIVTKELTINIYHVQAHRISCEYCNNPFSYVIGDQTSAMVSGVPVISNDEKMHQDAMKQAMKNLKKVSQKKNRGDALCPHCRRNQGFMVKSSFLSSVGCGAVIGVLLLAVGPLILNAFLDFTTNYAALILGGGFLGLLAGGAIGWTQALKVGPHPEIEDGRAMTDEELQDHLTQCEEQDYEPFLVWHLSLGFEPPENFALISLGLLDLTGDPVFPEDITAEHIMAEVEAASH